MDIFRNISLNEILLVYLVYNLFSSNNNSPYIKANYTITDTENADESDTLEKENIEHKKALLNKQLFNSNFNIHNARKRLKYVDEYFSHAERIKNRAVGIKKDGKKGTNKFLMDNLKHGLGDNYKNIESMINMLPLLSGMNEMKDILGVKPASSEIKEKTKAEHDEQKEHSEIIKAEKEKKNKRNLKEDKSYNDILELVDLLS